MQILLTYLCKSQKILTYVTHKCHDLTSSDIYAIVSTKATQQRNKIYYLKKLSDQLISDRLTRS